MSHNPYLDPEDVYASDGSVPGANPRNPFVHPVTPGTPRDDVDAASAGPMPAPYEPDPYGPPTGGPSNPFLGRPLVPGGALPPERQRYVDRLRANAWLSVLVPIASIIFFAIDKDKEPLYDQHLRETMNMGITRLAISVGSWLAAGFLHHILLLAGFVYFVLAVVGAFESTKAFPEGRPATYRGAIPFTRR